MFFGANMRERAIIQCIICGNKRAYEPNHLDRKKRFLLSRLFLGVFSLHVRKRWKNGGGPFLTFDTVW